MTRGDVIRNEAHSRYKNAADNLDESRMLSAFVEGARWADQHPKDNLVDKEIKTMEDFKIKYKFLHIKPNKQKQIAQKMYTDEFQSINNRQNILDFLKRVAEDGRFEELAMELGLIETSNEN